MNLLLSEEADSTGFYIYQYTKVRILNFLDEGIEVKKRSDDKWLGFIPYIFLEEGHNNLWLEKALYVTYLGQIEHYLLFSEKNPLEIIPEFNKEQKNTQKFMNEEKAKVTDHFQNVLFPNPSRESLLELEELLSNNNPIDVANAISQVALSFTPDYSFIKMVRWTLNNQFE